jgi:heme/copper-type cytochrome/quinol oxidase subunit 4
MVMTTQHGWLRPPTWPKSQPTISFFDLAMAFGWLPFYVWMLSTPLAGDVHSAAYRPAFKTAVAMALAVNFIHRHFVYFLFFGDQQQRRQHPRALWLVPLLVIGIVVPANWVGTLSWSILLGGVAAWNIWHTLMQRHGLARAYAVKAGGGLESAPHGKRDQALLFSATLWIAALVVAFRQDTFWGQAAKAFVHIRFINDYPALRFGIVVITAVVFGICAWRWVVVERAARPSSRVPRLTWLLSSVLILATFVINGPIIGYISFGVAHSIEYIMFVFMMANRRVDRGDRSVGVRALGTPLLFASTSAFLLLAFVAAREVWSLPLFAVYYTSTSIMHYYYDGIIWKLRRPELRAQLV